MKNLFYSIRKPLLLLAFFALAIGQSMAQGVTVSESSVTTYEDGSTLQYTIVLTAAPDPGETVTVTPSSDDPTEGTVSAAVSFTAADWDIPQAVTVTPGATGDGNDGHVSYTISNTVSTSGGSYVGVMAASINATNINIEGIAIIIVDPSSAIVVDEAGMMTQDVTFSVGPHLAPTSDVIVDLVNNSLTEVTFSTNSALLTNGNGYSTTVTITGVSDMVIEGTQPFSIATDPAVSADISFSGIDPVDIAGSVTDSTVTAAVPTLGEWGLIILSLLLLTFGMVALRSREVALAGVGNTSSFPTKLPQWPFDKAAFGKMLAMVMVGLAAIFSVAVAFFGYEMTNADVPGSLVAGPVLAYLLHLMVERKN